MLNVQKLLISGMTLEQLEEKFGIVSRVYEDRVVLNYKITFNKKNHPVVKECRGLILSLPDYEVVCRSFDRFFNYGECEEENNFDFGNSIFFEKVDGSLINVYYHPITGWEVATRGTAFAEGNTPLGKTYKELVHEAINNIEWKDFFENLHEDYTFIFELTSPENRIVTRYDKTELTLLAIRNNFDGKYVDYEDIEFYLNYKKVNLCFPKEANIKLVKSYNLKKDAQEIINFVESRNELDEGIVCYNIITQKRVKIKNSSYVAIHHLRGNGITIKSIVTLLLKGEVDEYLNYFPEDKELLAPYIYTYNKLKADVIETYELYRFIEDQKEFALKVKDLEYAWMLFQMRKGLHLYKIFDIVNLNKISKFY